MKIALRKVGPDGSWLDSAIDLCSGGGGLCHAEMVFSSGISFSATAAEPSLYRNGKRKPHGTRWKYIDYGSHVRRDRWVLIDLPVFPAFERAVGDFCDGEIDCLYDYWGCARFVSLFGGRGLIRESKDRWFCSEVVTAAVQHGVKWLHAALRQNPTNLDGALVAKALQATAPLIGQIPHKVAPNHLGRLFGVIR